MEVIAFDEDGNCLDGLFMDYPLPTSLECPPWDIGAQSPGEVAISIMAEIIGVAALPTRGMTPESPVRGDHSPRTPL